MELILKIDVDGVGFKDDLVNVKNGFGRNFLIPNGSAVLATSSAKKVLAENLKQRAFKEKKIVDDANKVSKKLLALEVKIKSKVGQGVKLFGSINNIDIKKSLETSDINIARIRRDKILDELLAHELTKIDENTLVLSYRLKLFQRANSIIFQNNTNPNIYWGFFLLIMKYSSLTKDQFVELHKEFIDFLSSNSITHEDWKILKDNNDVKS